MMSSGLIQSIVLNSSGHIYGSEWQDTYLLRDRRSLPRYGQLARKALLHYAGDRYNPNANCGNTELIVREIIHELISYKVFYRTAGYDWEWIDHCLRRAIGQCLRFDIPFDQARLDEGFAPRYQAAQLADPQHHH